MDSKRYLISLLEDDENLRFTIQNLTDEEIEDTDILQSLVRGLRNQAKNLRLLAFFKDKYDQNSSYGVSDWELDEKEQFQHLVNQYFPEADDAWVFRINQLYKKLTRTQEVEFCR